MSAAEFNPLALPMAVMGLRTRDVESFCAGVALVADAIRPGREYGTRFNAMGNSPVLTSFAAHVHARAIVPRSDFNPVGHARRIHVAVVSAAFRSLMAEILNQRSIVGSGGAPLVTDRFLLARRQDYDYWTRTIAEHIDEIHQ